MDASSYLLFSLHMKVLNLILAIALLACEVSAEDTADTAAIPATCVQNAIFENSKAIKSRYEKWLNSGTHVSGTLKVKFTIKIDGSVAELSIHESTTGNQRFDNKILEIVSAWNFAACSIHEDTEVIFPFVFGAPKKDYTAALIMGIISATLIVFFTIIILHNR